MTSRRASAAPRYAPLVNPPSFRADARIGCREVADRPFFLARCGAIVV